MVKRMLVMVLGIILFLVGAGAAVAGGALMLVFGSDSTLSSGQEPLSTQKSALVASMNDIQDTNGIAAAVGQPTLRLAATGTDTGRDVFIGIGPATAVERYLAGAPIDRVTDLEVDPFKLKTKARDGTATPAAPGAQTFWVARGSGPDASLSWKVRDGSYRMVLMNADGSPGVNADGRVQLKVPSLFAIGIGVLIGGVVLGLIGVTLLIVGVRMRPYGPPAAPGGAGYRPPGYSGPGPGPGYPPPASGYPPAGSATGYGPPGAGAGYPPPGSGAG